MHTEVPRESALHVLTRVLSDRIPLDLALDLVLSQERDLDPHARAWLRDVCSGTLRWKGRLDAAIDATALKKKPSGWLRKVLLLASYQLILQERVAPALVVNETVSLVKRKEGEAPANFANACLRKIADSAVAWKNLPFPRKGSVPEQAQWASFPEWMWSKLLAQRGIEWCEKFAEACYSRPEIWVHAHSSEGANPGAKLGKAGPILGSYQLTQGGLVSDQEGFSDGLFFVQDISSQILVSEIAQAVSTVFGKNPTALDLCAAPGGKAMGLAWNGFQVTATDVDPTRLKVVSQNLSRIKSQVESAGGKIDILDYEKVGELVPQDLIWVDAPCSGSGIIRRHPDTRWLRQDTDLVTLRGTQDALLRDAWSKTKSGGFLAYSVCSVFEDEGMGALKRAGLLSYVKKEWFLTPQAPPHGDGFWAALLFKA